ncbi:universal stress protein [uncultured Ruegeria sp.]|uniref:universal stress protein n=1 Tax=uncultured Ruegeria sp. TaxID=259304 RepID=UPI0026181824|nr:universal stress protein [uncultured Ruegeria sp.]
MNTKIDSTAIALFGFNDRLEPKITGCCNQIEYPGLSAVGQRCNQKVRDFGLISPLDWSGTKNYPNVLIALWVRKTLAGPNMLNKYLVAVEGSEGSQRALAHAIERAKTSNAELVLAHIIDWSPYSFHTPEELSARHKRREEELTRARDVVLAPIVKLVEDAGVKSSSEVRHGKAAETLAEMAIEHDVAQIIAGRSGESGVSSMLFGTTPSKLVQISSVPVLIVP